MYIYIYIYHTYIHISQACGALISQGPRSFHRGNRQAGVVPSVKHGWDITYFIYVHGTYFMG